MRSKCCCNCLKPGAKYVQFISPVNITPTKYAKDENILFAIRNEECCNSRISQTQGNSFLVNACDASCYNVTVTMEFQIAYGTDPPPGAGVYQAQIYRNGSMVQYSGVDLFASLPDRLIRRNVTWSSYMRLSKGDHVSVKFINTPNDSSKLDVFYSNISFQQLND